MRLSELVGKEIVNLNDGTRLGVVGESDLVINVNDGTIQSIVLPRKSTPLNFWVEKECMIIPWDSVKKIGAEIIIVELDETNIGMRGY